MKKILLKVNPFLGKRYDKLLHALFTFAIMIFLLKLVTLRLAIPISTIPLVCKSFLNYYSAKQNGGKDDDFWWDWLANVVGYLLALVYLVI